MNITYKHIVYVVFHGDGVSATCLTAGFTHQRFHDERLMRRAIERHFAELVSLNSNAGPVLVEYRQIVPT